MSSVFWKQLLLYGRNANKSAGLRGGVSVETSTDEFLLEYITKLRRKCENLRVGVVESSRRQMRAAKHLTSQCLGADCLDFLITAPHRCTGRMISREPCFSKTFTHFLINVILNASCVINTILSFHCNRNWAQHPFSTQMNATFTLWKERNKGWSLWNFLRSNC